MNIFSKQEDLSRGTVVIIVQVDKANKSPFSKMNNSLWKILRKMYDTYWSIIGLPCFIAEYWVINDVGLF